MNRTTPALTRLPSPLAAVALWLVDLDRPAPDEGDHGLSAAEQARAARFAFEPLRRRYRAAHHALRTVLAQHTGRPADALEFGVGAYDKPYLVHAGMPAFNLSHSDRWALIAVGGRQPVGIDIELLHEVPDAAALVASLFTPREQAQWQQADEGAGRRRAFLAAWTRKEACLKALGTGLSLPAEVVDAGCDEVARRVRIDHAGECATVDVVSLDLNGAPLDAAAALAVWVDAPAGA